jgi:hypothetical protein
MSAAENPLTFPEPFEVTISYKGGKISVNPEAVELDKTKGHHVVWVADGDFDFYICFERDTPFAGRHFHKGSNASGRPRSSATGRYKYWVEIDGQVLDPDIIVKP